MDRKFQIAEFKDGIELVPSKWIDKKKNKCSWPKYDSLRFQRAVKNEEESDPSWTKYKIIRILGSTDDYNRVLEKLTKAKYQTDVDTTDVEVKDVPQKRPRTFSNSSAESVNSYTQICPLPTPPPKKHRLDETSPLSSSSNKKQGLLKIYKRLEFKVGKIQATLDDVLVAVRKNIVRNYEAASKQKYKLPKLPLETQEELNDIEENLATEEYQNFMVAELRKLGGKKLSDLVFKMLNFLISYSLGCNCSYFGTKDKKSFSALKLCDIMCDVVRLYLPNASNEDLKEPIQTWLRHCKEKLQKKKS